MPDTSAKGNASRRISNRTNLSATGKKATITRALPGNKVALDDGVIADIAPGVYGLGIGSKVLYVRGGPGVNSGFAMIIGHG